MKNKILAVMAVILLSLVSVSNATSFNKPNLRVDATTYGSYNWAGYVVNSGTYTSASGNWIVPTISTTNSGYSSAWVGVGGFSGNTVIQIGTEQDCSTGSIAGERRYHGLNDVIVDSPNKNDKSNGKSSTSCKPVYYAWWELYPQNAEQQISGFTVSPGDTITASVTQSGSSWVLTITDATTGQTFSTTQTPNFVPDQGSAETIMERPSLCTMFNCKLTNLANFGTINFNSVSSSSGTFDSSANGIIMVDNGFKTMAYPTPNPITTPGQFSVNWVRGN